MDTKGHVESASFSPDGSRIVTASSDNTTKVWDATSGAQILAPANRRCSVLAASFSPDGLRLLTLNGALVA